MGKSDFIEDETSLAYRLSRFAQNVTELRAKRN